MATASLNLAETDEITDSGEPQNTDKMKLLSSEMH